MDARGNQWSPDQFYSGASKRLQTSRQIYQTSDVELYQTARSFRRNGVGPYTYEIPVPAIGYYRLVLGFAEISGSRQGIGRRLARIVVEGHAKHEKFDIVEASGDSFTRVKVPLGPIYVGDGHLSVGFELVKFNPMVSTIEVYKLSDGSVLKVKDP